MPKASDAKSDGKKISLPDLMTRMQDPAADPRDFAKYFQVDEAAAEFFRPRVTFNPDLVAVEPATPQGRVRSDAALSFLNGSARAWREARFVRKRLSGYTGPIIVSEGDSWFQFPLLLWDVIDNLSETYAIASLDAAGDTLQQMIDQDEYLDRIAETGATILLFSGGGNDVLGGGDLKSHLRPFDANLTPAQHVKSSFTGLLDHAISQFDQIYRRVAREAPGVDIVTHGYDHAIPASGKWLGKPMEGLGIVDKPFQQAIIRELIDRFALAMSRLAARHPHVHFLDNRKTIKASEWHDELHPVNSGYAKIAAAFDAKIKELVALPRDRALAATAQVRTTGSRRAPAASTHPALVDETKALSLHIGLNEVDPGHYGSKCELGGCHADAKDMAELAGRKGYKTIATLLDHEATVKRLKESVKEAAAKLRPGGIFLLTYAGHGGQMVDFNLDEIDDGQDETWCLYDRQFLDDELYELWRDFKEGVRVLVVSDSCHSGSVIRATASGSMTLDVGAPGAFPFKVRALPRAVINQTITRHRDFYRQETRGVAGVPRALRDADTPTTRRPRLVERPLAASVRLLSGCQDNQVSADIGTNGLFTLRLLGVLQRGFSGNYAQFHKEIRKVMPENQSPNHWVIGRKDAAFDGQQPFEV